MRFIAYMCVLATAMLAQSPRQVEIQVNAAARQGPFRPIYAYFGYDEPNYTYTPNGHKLIAELGALSSVKVQIRAQRIDAELEWRCPHHRRFRDRIRTRRDA